MKLGHLMGEIKGGEKVWRSSGRGAGPVVSRRWLHLPPAQMGNSRFPSDVWCFSLPVKQHLSWQSKLLWPRERSRQQNKSRAKMDRGGLNGPGDGGEARKGP